MNREIIKSKMQRILKQLFMVSDSSIETLNADTVDGWDSLTHVKLILAVEEEFSFQFSLREISSLNNIGEMMDLIFKKTSS